MDRIIFIDIDGPLIPSGMYLLEKSPSKDRHFSLISLAVLRKIVNVSQAKIVTNSSHNYYLREEGNVSFTLQDDLVRSGIDVGHFHPTAWRTDYGMPCVDPYHVVNDRYIAIQLWLQKHGTRDTEWICFDDVPFTTDKRLIVVDFDQGLHPGHYNAMGEIWGHAPIIIW